MYLCVNICVNVSVDVCVGVFACQTTLVNVIVNHEHLFARENANLLHITFLWIDYLLWISMQQHSILFFHHSLEIN